VVTLEQELSVKIKPIGPDPGQARSRAADVMAHPAVTSFLQRSRHRLLAFQLLEPPAKTARPRLPDRYLATIYDYTGNRTVLITGRMNEAHPDGIEELATQPLPGYEEFRAAVRMVVRDDDLGPLLRDRSLIPYRAMPPIIELETPDGRIERTIAVGLLPAEERGARHEIVGVNMVRRRVVRFEGGAPPGAEADNSICGLPDANQSVTPVGTPGQAEVSAFLGNSLLWRFRVVRPAASSGTRGSGVELRYVDYKGKRVLYRAHVPILNVQYEEGPCGPYRDWQYSESAFQANGADVAPGVRLCPVPAATIVDSGNDAGNFRGVAIFVQGPEVVVVSELDADWYRYTSEWRLHVNGTIKPRFGFTGTSNSCVCHTHRHHAYWRLDFDIRTAAHNRVLEFNDPPLVGGSKWHTKTWEARRFRDPAHKRKWRVENTTSGEGYTVVPGPDDGASDPYAWGDLWILRYRATELDDGHNSTLTNTEADLEQFRSPAELIDDHDVVVWYVGHFSHEAGEEVGHRVGPDLVPSQW
jgi:hypothetical protein